MAVYMTGDIHGNPSRFYDLKSFCKVHSSLLYPSEAADDL